MSAHHHQQQKNLSLLILGAIGVVFGDIGTSPLYALKVAVEASAVADHGITAAVLGILSLISWSLIIVVTLKYVLIVMRADNHGEGGVFALTALVMDKIGTKGRGRWLVIIAGTLGASLFFGDSMITPAISVLSAVEGLKIIAPSLQPYILPIAILLISALFAVERFGTAKVGVVFGPIMVV
jgi:KUP system potassium uptake protein